VLCFEQNTFLSLPLFRAPTAARFQLHFKLPLRFKEHYCIFWFSVLLDRMAPVVAISCLLLLLQLSQIPTALSQKLTVSPTS
jgi:hypothetical protein